MVPAHHAGHRACQLSRHFVVELLSAQRLVGSSDTGGAAFASATADSPEGANSATYLTGRVLDAAAHSRLSSEVSEGVGRLASAATSGLPCRYAIAIRLQHICSDIHRRQGEYRAACPQPLSLHNPSGGAYREHAPARRREEVGCATPDSLTRGCGAARPARLLRARSGGRRRRS